MTAPREPTYQELSEELRQYRRGAITEMPLHAARECPDCGLASCEGCGYLSRVDYAIINDMATARRPGCHNKPRPTAATTYTAQSGWREYEERGAIVRVSVWVKVPYRFSTECQYDKSATDSGCAGCVHGEGRP